MTDIQFNKLKRVIQKIDDDRDEIYMQGVGDGREREYIYIYSGANKSTPISKSISNKLTSVLKSQ